MTSPTRPSLSLEQFVIGLFHGLAQRGYTHILKSEVGGTHVAANRAYQQMLQHPDFIDLKFKLPIDPVFHEADGWNEIIKLAIVDELLKPYRTEHTLVFNSLRLAILRRDIPGDPEVWDDAVDAFVNTELPVRFLRRGDPVE